MCTFSKEDGAAAAPGQCEHSAEAAAVTWMDLR